MNTLSWLVDGSFSMRLTLALLHFLWQGCAGGMLVIVGGWLLSNATARLRYSLNVAAMLLLAACLPVTFFLLGSPEVGADRFLPVRNVHGSPEARLSTAVAPDSANELPFSDKVGSSHPRKSSVASIPKAETGSNLTDGSSSQVFASAWRSIGSMPFDNAFPTVSRWVTALYLAGVTLILGRLLWGVWGGHRLRKLANVVQDHVLLQMVRDQARRLGLKAVPAVAWCEQISIPVVVGIVTPMILLPMAVVSGLTPTQLQALLLHELSHIRRFDPVVNLLQRIIEAILFFHPVVWFVSRRISIEREHAADDMVLAAGLERPLYADALVRVAELASAISRPDFARRGTALGAAGANPSEFKRRVLRLLGDSHPPKLDLSRAGILMTLLVVIGGAYAWSQPDKQEKTAERSGPTKVNNSGPVAHVTTSLPLQNVVPKEPVDPVKELASFQGTWCFDLTQPWTWPQPIGVGTDSDGRQSERRWVVKGNQITWVGRDGERIYVTFTIDPFKTPKQIDFTFLNGPYRGRKSIGIYEPQIGNESYLWLCMTDPGTDAPRPTDVSAGSFKQQSMIGIHQITPPEKASAAKILERFQGVWQMTLCDSMLETFGATQQEASKWQWTIKGDEILWNRQGDVWKLKLDVDPSKAPKEMDLTYLSGPFKGAKCLGMYEFGGVDRQSLLISIQDPGSTAPRPTEIAMSSSVKTGLIFLRPSKPSDAEREIASFQGTWTLRNFDTGNFAKNKDPSSWPLPAGKGPDSSGAGSELRWVVKGNQITWTSRSGEEIKASFTIDPLKRPKQIDLTFLSGPNKGEMCPGLYQRGDLDENILWLCMANPGSKTDRPKEFSYEWGQGRSVLSLYPFEPSGDR